MKAIIFDLDMTLVDSSRAEEARNNREWKKAMELIPSFSLYEGVNDVFDFIRGNHVKVAIVSSSPSMYVNAVLEHFSIPYSSTVCYHDTRLHKPEAEPMLKAISLLEERQDNIIAFGDQSSDIIAANRANIQSVACLWGASNPSSLSNSEAGRIIKTPKEIIALLSNHSHNNSGHLTSFNYQEPDSEKVQLERLVQHLESTKRLSVLAKLFPVFSFETFHAPFYLENTENVSIKTFLPIPHLYIEKTSLSSYDTWIERLQKPEHVLDDDSCDQVFNYILSLMHMYSSVHVFFMDSGTIAQPPYLPLRERLETVDGITVDNSVELGAGDYGEPLYYEEKDSLFIAINLISKATVLHGQVEPLTNWTQSDVTSECFNSLFISFIKADSTVKTDTLVLNSIQKRQSAERIILKTADLLKKVSDWPTPGVTGLRHMFFYDYNRTVTDEARRTILNFKNNDERTTPEMYQRALDNVVPKVTSLLKKTFGDSTQDLTLFCIPASTFEGNCKRFGVFSERVCNELKMNNAFGHYHYENDGEAKHLGGNSEAVIVFDQEFFSGKNIIMFDDLYTWGRTSGIRKRELEDMGANIIALITIGKTVHY